MRHEDLMTPEEDAYARLIEEAREVFSGAAGTVISEAEGAAYGENLIRTYIFHPDEYEEALDKMRLAAAELTYRERKLLARLWRAALAAAASIDPSDGRPVDYYKAVRGDFHWHYRMLSGMIEKVLQERVSAELREIAMREPDDFADVPF